MARSFSQKWCFRDVCGFSGYWKKCDYEKSIRKIECGSIYDFDKFIELYNFFSKFIFQSLSKFLDYTTSEMLQNSLEKVLEKKAGRTYGAPGNRRLIYFIGISSIFLLFLILNQLNR